MRREVLHETCRAHWLRHDRFGVSVTIRPWHPEFLRDGWVVRFLEIVVRQIKILIGGCLRRHGWDERRRILHPGVSGSEISASLPHHTEGEAFTELPHLQPLIRAGQRRDRILHCCPHDNPIDCTAVQERLKGRTVTQGSVAPHNVQFLDTHDAPVSEKSLNNRRPITVDYEAIELLSGESRDRDLCLRSSKGDFADCQVITHTSPGLSDKVKSRVLLAGRSE